jgi:small subunit ribosomal protein S1
LNFKVIEFNRDDKRILVSHSRIVEDAKKVADDADRKARAGEEGEMRKAVEDTQNKVEKDTLGDLAALVQLKDQLNDSN